MSVLVRASLRQVAPRRVPTAVQRRFMSAEPEKGWHIPFDYYSSKTAFATKVVSFFIAGFSVPFVASVYQLRKSGAGSA